MPTLYQAIVSASNYKPEKMASLDLVLYGGAPIMPALLDRIDREWPAAVRHIYGTTEIMCALYNPEPVGRPVTLRPGYYSRVRVVRHGGNENDLVRPGEAGELIVDASADTFFSGLPQSSRRERREAAQWLVLHRRHLRPARGR